MSIRNVKLLRAVKHDGVWYQPGVGAGNCLPLSDKDAKYLIAQRVAEDISTVQNDVQINETPVVPEVAVALPVVPELDVDSNPDEVDDIAELTRIAGVNEDLARALLDAGYHTINDVACADAADLVKIKGIGKKSSVSILESAITVMVNGMQIDDTLQEGVE